MSHRSFFISVTIAVLLFPFSARSQESVPARASDEGAAAATRKKAIDLLQSVAGQVASLHSAENRARIGSNVADLLWNHDEKLSRSLFGGTEEDIKAGFSNTEPDGPAQIHTLMVFGKLRSDILGRIAKHDPDLAMDFLLATRPASDMQLPYQMRDEEKSLELRLASQIAAKNPQLALKFGRESLAKDFSIDLLPVLSELQLKDKEAALSFYKAIVDKLRSANLAQDKAASDLALNLARSFQPPDADEQIYRDLLGIILESALASGCANGASEHNYYLCWQIGSIFSKLEKYHPQGTAPLKRWVEGGQNHYPSPVSAQIREVFENGTVNEILALAQKYPDMQGQIYWQAMTKAESSGDFVTARQIASDSPSEEQRPYMLAQIDRDQAWRSVNADQMAAIQQRLSNLRNNDERIQFLLYVASRVGGNDRKAALGLLNQAGQIIDSTPPGKSQLEGQMALAMLYCSLKSDRGFAIMESIIPKLNELVAGAATLDGFENHYLRDGEWNMTGEGVVGGLLTALAQNAGYFAEQDFDRSVTLARQFDRAELRLMAELRIAQSVLGNQPKQALTFNIH